MAAGNFDFATNAVVLGTALIAFTTVVNALGVKLMATINSAGVFIELIAACLIALILALHVTRGPGVLFSTNGYGAGTSGGYLGAFLVASLASGYVMYGFDTASSLGEETLEPRRTAPRAILRAILASFVIGGAILVFAIMSAPDLRIRRSAAAAAACSTSSSRSCGGRSARYSSVASSWRSRCARWPCTRPRSG